MEQVLSRILMLIGAAFMLITALGVLRLPDLFMRMHSNTKSATLGVFCIMMGLSLHFGDFSTFVRALAVVLFLVVTAPVAAQMIARAAYFSGVTLWEGTLSDDLEGHYSLKTHALESLERDGDQPDR